MRSVIHIADIHIGSGRRSAEYRIVFDKLIATVNLLCMQSLLDVVIAGDVFHHKIKYSGNDVDDFNYLLSGLSKLDINIIIIPGNHDANLNDPGACDLIQPLIDDFASTRARIFYFRNSATKTIDGLNYNHISVFDQSTREQIDAAEAAAAPVDSDDILRILLYHGSVDGAKFGSHTDYGTRISAETMSKYSCVMLGDIHQSQFITPTVAYSGSLIQQNLGENTEKGFILWEFTQTGPRGKFSVIQNDYGFAKFDLRGGTPETVAQMISAAPKYLIAAAVQCDPGSAHLSSEITKICSIVRVTSLGVTPAATPATPTGDGITAVSQPNPCEPLLRYLANAGTPAEITGDAVKLFASRAAVYTPRTWQITRMEFSNLFKYAAGNVINFNSLDGLTGVIAPNRAGKSSILDIIVFGLFNEHLRADNKNIIREGATSASLRIEFTINGIAYTITRDFDKTRHSKHSLICNGVNITEPSITATYKKLTTLLGSLEKFLATAMYYDPSHDLFRMGRADRLRMLPELFGMIDNEALIAEIKQKAKTVAAELSKLVKHRHDPTVEIASLEAKLTESSVSLSAKQELINTLEATLAHARGKTTGVRRVATIEREISAQKLLLKDLKPLPECDSCPRVVLTREAAAEYAKECERGTDIGRDPTDVAAAVRAAEHALAGIKPQQFTAAQLQSALAKLSANLAATTVTVRDRVPIDEMLTAANSKLDRVITNLAGLRTQTITDVTPLQRQVDALAVYQFDPDCECCRHNKAIVDGGVTDQLDSIIAANKHAAAENEWVETTRVALARERDQIRSEIAGYNETLTEIAAESKRAVAAAQLRNKIQNDIFKIEEKLRDCDDAAASKSAELSSKIAAYKRFLNAHTAITAAEKYLAYTAYCDYKTAAADNLRVAASIAMLQAELESARGCEVLLSQIASTESKLAEARLAVATSAIDVVKITTALESERAELAVMVKYLAESTPLEHKLSVYKTLASALSSSELKIAIVRENVDALIASANSVLNVVADFRLAATVGDAAIDFNIIEKNSNGTERTVPSSLASGYQKFICAVAIRIALSIVTPSRANFMFIDEGFGALDPDNIRLLCENFHLMIGHLPFVFVISHLAELQSMFLRPLRIATSPAGSIIIGAGVNTPVVTPAVVPVNTPVNTPTVTPVNTPATAVQRKGKIARPKTGPAAELAAIAAQTPAVAPAVTPAVTPVVAPTDAANITCECGAVVKKSSLNGHKKTAKHAAGLK